LLQFSILFGSCLFLLLRFFLRFLYDLREVIYDLRLNFHLFFALLVWPVCDAYHLAFFLTSRPKLRLFFFAIDVEVDFSGSNINLCSYGAKEWSPKNEQ
jgi:hypothetical protein